MEIIAKARIILIENRVATEYFATPKRCHHDDYQVAKDICTVASVREYGWKTCKTSIRG